MQKSEFFWKHKKDFLFSLHKSQIGEFSIELNEKVVQEAGSLTFTPCILDEKKASKKPFCKNALLAFFYFHARKGKKGKH